MRILFVLGLLAMVGQLRAQSQQPTIDQTILNIIQQTHAPIAPKTVDVVKEGDPGQPIKGIVTCMFATMDVLREAASKGCNLVIAHEPLYYNHFDETKWFENDAVFKEKKQYILDHHLVVWRFHDYIHRIGPDAIVAGVVEKLGWNKYVVNKDLDELSFSGKTLTDILKDLKKTFPNSTFSIVGNPAQEIVHVRLAPGAAGSTYQISLLERDDVDLVIAGEAPQWETYEYVRDAVSQGRKKAVIFLGHIPSEEPGMEYAAKWIRKFVTSVPVHFVECKPSYWTY